MQMNKILQRDINIREMFTTFYGKKLYLFVRNDSDEIAKRNVSLIIEEVIETIQFSLSPYMDFSKGINENLAIIHNLCSYSDKSDELEDKLKSIFVLPQNLIRVISNKVDFNRAFFSNDSFKQLLDYFYIQLKEQNLLSYLQNIKLESVSKFINGYSITSQTFAISIDIYLFLLVSVNKNSEYIELLQNKNILKFILDYDLEYLNKDLILSYIVFDELVN